MKNKTTQEIKNSEKGISLDIVYNAKLKAPCKITKSKLKVYPFYEEKSFKNKRKVFPSLYIQNETKYVAMIVNDKIISVSELHQASQKFKQFAQSF